MLDFPGPGGLTAGQVFSSGGKSWQWDGAKWGPATGGGAPLDSPVFTGDPKAPTPATADDDTSVATTAFVKAQGYLAGNQTLTLSGDVTGSGATAITTALAAVNANIGTFQGLTLDAKGRVTAAANQSYAPLASPTFTGTPTLPAGTVGVTQATANNTTALATTAFVKAQAYLTANQPITLSGDITGSGTTAIAGTLAAVNANVGTFQGLTVNAKGLVTAAANQSYVTGGPYLALTGGTLSGLLTVNSNVVVTGGFVAPNGNGYFGKDTGGTTKSLLTLATDNQVYISDGGGRQVIIQDQVKALSDIIVPNNKFFWGLDSGGTARQLAGLNPSNQLSYGYGTNYMLIYPGVTTYYKNVRHDFQDTNGAALTVFQAAGTYNQSGAWIALSDRSLKVAESIVPYERGLAAVKELRPVSFVYAAGTPFADENETVRIGLLADEAEAVVPEIVGEASFEKTGSVQTVSSGLLVFALINSVQELLTRIETLEARLPPAAAQ